MSAKVRVLRVTCVLGMLWLTGCVSGTETADDGSRTTHILGYTKVRRPATWSSGEPARISAVARIGASFGSEGLLLGYDDRTLVRFPPSDRGYLFIDVRSEEDLQRVIEIIQQEQFKGYPLCLSIDAIGPSVKPSVAR